MTAAALAVLLVLATLFLAYANGSNDNLKGMATVIGSNTLSYKSALILATLTTFAGSLASIFLAAGLIKGFSGSGILPSHIAGTPALLLAVGLGAGLTVLLATILGLPVSTTHGLTGALFGAGLVAAGTGLKLGALGSSFFLPLLVSPMLAIALTAPIHHSALALRSRKRRQRQNSGDIGGPHSLGAAAVAEPSAVSHEHAVRPKLMTAGHISSASLLCFSRGLNDTPKIVALILAVEGLGINYGMIIIAVSMAAGGVFSGWKVANTMGNRISHIDASQGLVANVISSFLVIGASRYGMPVSTTHVTVGAIAGVGLLNHSARWRMLGQILLAWLLTLPLAAAIGAGAYAIVSTNL
jgi:PiT family inorganic phosphate transporter